MHWVPLCSHVNITIDEVSSGAASPAPRRAWLNVDAMITTAKETPVAPAPALASRAPGSRASRDSLGGFWNV